MTGARQGVLCNGSARVLLTKCEADRLAGGAIRMEVESVEGSCSRVLEGSKTCAREALLACEALLA